MGGFAPFRATLSWYVTARGGMAPYLSAIWTRASSTARSGRSSGTRIAVGRRRLALHTPRDAGPVTLLLQPGRPTAAPTPAPLNPATLNPLGDPLLQPLPIQLFAPLPRPLDQRRHLTFLLFPELEFQLQSGRTEPLRHHEGDPRPETLDQVRLADPLKPSCQRGDQLVHSSGDWACSNFAIIARTLSGGNGDGSSACTSTRRYRCRGRYPSSALGTGAKRSRMSVGRVPAPLPGSSRACPRGAGRGAL